MSKEGQIRIGLWQGDGNTFKHGRPFEINGVKYWVNLYHNDKQNERQPDLNIVLTPVEEKVPF